MKVLQNNKTNLMIYFEEAQHPEVLNIVYSEGFAELFVSDSKIQFRGSIYRFETEEVALKNWNKLINLLQNSD